MWETPRQICIISSKLKNPQIVCITLFPPYKSFLPWRPDPQQSTSGAYLSESIVQDLASFPTREVRDALFNTYFEDIHPCFPVIDKQQFQQQYADPDNPPPLILYHAVLLIAARISDHPMIKFSRAMVTATLYRRAKALFDMRHENDRSFLVQAALLMSWHIEDPDDISGGAYYWVGQACRIALGLGMHRDQTGKSTSPMPDFDRRQYRRLFWLALQSEAMTAIEHGRPLAIRPADYDQPYLSEEEFLDFDGSADASISQVYFGLHSVLCELALELSNRNAARSKIRPAHFLESRLARLGTKLPRGQSFEACQLRVTYSLLSLVYHRSVGAQEAAFMAQEAPSTILTTLEAMIASGSIRKCPSLLRENAAQVQLERLMRPMSVLSEYWPHVEAMSKLCASLSRRSAVMIDGHFSRRPSAEDHNFVPPAGPVDIPWQDVMAGYQFKDLGGSFEIENWMNTV